MRWIPKVSSSIWATVVGRGTGIVRTKGMLNFRRYWFGTPDAEGKNLATCVWRSRGDAIRAGHTPGHRKAARATAAMYAEWKIDRHRLVVGEGARRWRLVDWRDEDEGSVWGL